MLTENDYNKEISALAKWFNDTDAHNGDGVAMEYGPDYDRDDALFETLNNHRFIIYTAYSRYVVAHSVNANAMFEEYGDTMVHTNMLDERRALCAMRADVYSEALRTLEVKKTVNYVKSRHQ